MTKFNFYWQYIERPRRIISGFFLRKMLKWDNAKHIQWGVNKHRNELVLSQGNEVARLLGWTDQYEDDYYWVIYVPRTGVRLETCVGGPLWLKKRLSGFEYYRLERNFEINNPMEIAKQLIEEQKIILK